MSWSWIIYPLHEVIQLNRIQVWFVVMGVLCIIIGGLLSRWHLIFFDVIEGRLNLSDISITMGALILAVSGWLLKLSKFWK